MWIYYLHTFSFSFQTIMMLHSIFLWHKLLSLIRSCIKVVCVLLPFHSYIFISSTLISNWSRKWQCVPLLMQTRTVQLWGPDLVRAWVYTWHLCTASGLHTTQAVCCRWASSKVYPTAPARLSPPHILNPAIWGLLSKHEGMNNLQWTKWGEELYCISVAVWQLLM